MIEFRLVADSLPDEPQQILCLFKEYEDPDLYGGFAVCTFIDGRFINDCSAAEITGLGENQRELSHQPYAWAYLDDAEQAIKKAIIARQLLCRAASD